MSELRVGRGKQGVFLLFLDRLVIERILQQRWLTFLSDASLASYPTGESI